jgi:pyochelin synthetase
VTDTAADITRADDPIDLPELLSELDALGVQLWSEEGRLQFRAPQGVLTEERRDLLRRHRDAVLAFLDAEEAAGALVEHPDDAHEPFPLTDVQAAYLVGRTDALDYGGIACHGYLEVALGDVEPERVAAAWTRLVRRHAMLRAVVDPSGLTQVRPDVPGVEVPVTDVRGAGRQAAEAATAANRERLGNVTYDPATGPLHALHVTRGDGPDGAESMLHLSVDLLCADFASVQLLLGELGLLLRGAPLPPLDITFRDYVLAERRLRDTRRYRRDRTWWLDRVDDLPPRPDLPLAATARRTGAARFRRLQRRLPERKWAAVRAGAARAGLTTSAVVLAAYAEVIGRWSATPAFTLNLPLQNRLALHEQVCGLVGDFTSVSLLVVDTSRPTAFTERARELSDQLLADLDHRLFSGVEVMREIGRRRGRDAALMPVVFTGVLASAGGGAGEIRAGVSQTPQVWIDCQAVDSSGDVASSGGLLLSWDVREGVFPHGLVEDAFGAFVDVLGRLAADPETWDHPAPVDLPDTQRERRRRVNATAGAKPDGLLHDPWLDAARRHPDSPAVIATDGELSHGELLRRACAVAGRLHGLGPGELVGVCMDKGVDQVVAVLGVALAGGAYLPLDPAHPEARRTRIVADAGLRTMLTREDVAGIPAPASVPPAPASSPDDLAYVIYTSGSTGAPKGVMITHRAARTTVDDITARFGVTAADRVLGVAQLGFDLSVYDLFGVLGAGGTLVLPDPTRRSDSAHWAQLLARHGITLWNSVPAQAQMLADHLAATGASAASLRHVLLSGDWIPVTLPAHLRSVLPGPDGNGAVLTSLGGATEAAIWSISHPIGDVPAGARSILYGRPLTNQTFTVLDHGLRDRPDYVPGELYIGGDGLAAGYLGDPVLTAARFVTDPGTGQRLYRTGDLGRYLPSGDIEFLGRTDDQVKIRGHRIELAEVDAALGAHPTVGSHAVIVVGEGLHRRIAAFVTPVPIAEDPGDTRRAADGSALAAAARGADPVAAVSRAEVEGFTRALDQAELTSALAALRAAGLFQDPSHAHTSDEVVHRAAVADRHHGLVRRWLDVLVREGLLVRDGEILTATTFPTATDRDRAWEAVRESRTDALSAPEVVEYLQEHAVRMGELLRGELDPVGLLFPAGRTDLARAVYAGNLIARYMNEVAAGVIAAEAGDRTEPLRVLEVGGGVGATTEAVLDALAGRPVEYLFTDVSLFFLTHARDRFPTVRTALVDIDTPLDPAIVPDSGFDVVVAGGVLNNARDIGDTLRRLRRALAPGGLLVITEPTREHYEVMGSQAFMMAPVQDTRARTGRTFLELAEWLAELSAAEFSPVGALPDPEGAGAALAPLGQHVVVARATAAAPPPDPRAVRTHLAELLPDYMVPTTIDVLAALPVTGNSKVDRAALAAIATQRAPGEGADAPGHVDGEDAPRDELEATIGRVLAEVVERDAVPRNADLFQIGFDSLLLAQVAGRLIEELDTGVELHFDALLRQLLAAPTLAEFAAFLRGGSDGAAAAPDETGDLLVALGGADSGTATVVVAERADLGPRLTERLGTTGPLVALVVRDGPLARWVADATGALRERGSARLRVIGHGAAAGHGLELATALVEDGVDVDSLTLIDPEPRPDLAELSPYTGALTVLTGHGRAAHADAWRSAVLGDVTVAELDAAGLADLSALSDADTERITAVVAPTTP